MNSYAGALPPVGVLGGESEEQGRSTGNSQKANSPAARQRWLAALASSSYYDNLKNSSGSLMAYAVLLAPRGHRRC